MKDFRDLQVWERSHRLTLAIYAATMKFPRQELYGLTSQIRRCAVSIGVNNAEGCGKMGITSSNVFFRLRPAQRVNWITNCCLPKTWVT